MRLLALLFLTLCVVPSVPLNAQDLETKKRIDLLEKNYSSLTDQIEILRNDLRSLQKENDLLRRELADFREGDSKSNKKVTKKSEEIEQDFLVLGSRWTGTVVGRNPQPFQAVMTAVITQREEDEFQIHTTAGRVQWLYNCVKQKGGGYRIEKAELIEAPENMRTAKGLVLITGSRITIPKSKAKQEMTLFIVRPHTVGQGGVEETINLTRNEEELKEEDE